MDTPLAYWHTGTLTRKPRRYASALLCRPRWYVGTHGTPFNKFVERQHVSKGGPFVLCGKKMQPQSQAILLPSKIHYNLFVLKINITFLLLRFYIFTFFTVLIFQILAKKHLISLLIFLKNQPNYKIVVMSYMSDTHRYTHTYPQQCHIGIDMKD